MAVAQTAADSSVSPRTWTGQHAGSSMPGEEPMANREHIMYLRSGVRSWNAWRMGAPHIQPDLRGAKLAEMYLFGANLAGADLSGADLHQADLSRADLDRAILRSADLNGALLNGATLRGADLGASDAVAASFVSADLSEARLNGATLRRADLTGASADGAAFAGTTLLDATLSGSRLRGADCTSAYFFAANLTASDMGRANLAGADLREANLSYADLGQADLHGANLCLALLVGTGLAGATLDGCRFGATLLARLDLSAAQHLETCHHLAPSLITTDTLSHSAIPPGFLQGAGVSSTEPSSPQQATLALFITYADAQLALAKTLEGDLREDGWRVWLLPETATWDRAVWGNGENEGAFNRLIVLDSAAARSSPGVGRQIEYARRCEERFQQDMLFMISADAGPRATVDMSIRPDIDLSVWRGEQAYRTALAKLLGDLRG
jgi:uncharacterized protein YjbI with pentapeptide repeats